MPTMPTWRVGDLSYDAIVRAVCAAGFRDPKLFDFTFVDGSIILAPKFWLSRAEQKRLDEMLQVARVTSTLLGHPAMYSGEFIYGEITDEVSDGA